MRYVCALYCVDVSRVVLVVCCLVFFFKQKTAYELRISDWSSDVCSSDLRPPASRSTTPMPSASTTAASPLCRKNTPRHAKHSARRAEIGRASCRERVCQYV